MPCVRFGSSQQLSRSAIDRILRQSFNLLNWNLLFAGLFVIAFVSWLILSAFNSFYFLETFDAIWATHDASTTYYYENAEIWPEEWDDLYPILTQRDFDSDRIARIQDIVDFNFQVDPSDSITEFEAISMRDGTRNGELHMANRRIRDILIKSRD